MKMLKRFLAIALAVCMMFTVVPFSAFANEASAADNTATASAEDDFQRILHLDCGRKYFSKDWIIALINEMAAAGYTHLELAVGNDGLRLLLDDMSVGSYSDDAVTAAIQAGNEAYYDAGDVNELTEAEMDEIIAHAKAAGIEIIPLVNTPGHMDAIITAMQQLGFSSPQYGSSARTVDVTDTAAVAFTQELVCKYIDYFAAKGCAAFNIGADEYANDTGNPQFSALISYGYYDEYVSYLNTLAEYAVSKGMTPMAFNDGIYYNQNTSNGTFNENLAICYWSSGWSGYDVASASYLANKGFEMINTHGDYYFVLTSSGITNPSSTALNFDNSTFMGSTISDPAGAMFCIWCDAPGIATETEVAAAVRLTLRKMAASMQGTDAYSEDVVAGGFNEDGTINTDEAVVKTLVTLTDNDVSVTAYDLTTLTVETATAPTIAGADEVQAWSVTPATADGNYTGSATVSVPVPDGWTKVRGGVLASDNGEEVLNITGELKNGYFTFTAPHFSTVVAYDIAYDELVELTVGQTTTITDSTGNYASSYTGEGLDTNIATVDVEGVEAVTGTTVSTTKATELEAGATYILRVYNTTYALSTNAGRGDWGTQTLAFESNTLTANTAHMWTLEASGDGYKLKSAAGYLNLGTGNNTAYVAETGEVFTFASTTTGWTIKNPSGEYINALGGLTTYYSAGGWTGDGTRFDLYKVTEATSASTEITIEGKSAGETSVTVGNTIYKIIIHGYVDITVKYVTEDGTVVKTETVSVLDNATSATLSNFNYNDKYYVVENTTLAITPATVTEYSVKVTETTEDLSAVDSLTIEYWITNGRVTDNAYDDSTNLNYLSINATDSGIYSENGVAIADLVPATATRENRTLEFWQTKLLDTILTNDSASGTQEQTEAEGDDETLEGSAITRVRYWNGSWQVLTGSTWTNVASTHQLVAYYLEIIEIYNDNGETELFINAADWGFASGDNWGYWTGGYTPCTVSIQIVYEDGTTNPGDTTVNTLLTKTLVYAYWDGGRGLGTMIFNGDDYNIYKVTAETGDATYTNSNYGFTINSFTWDGNEETVWSGDATNSVSIGNPARTPGYEEPKDNLTWNTGDYNENNAILIRVYVKAVETEDSLTVVYYDEKFGDTLYTYNINVPSGTIFSNDYFDPDPTTFTGNADRIDVSNAGIVNTNGVTQYFQTDLTLVPEAIGKYNSSLYTYTGSKISDDGKTLYLYYNIDTTVLSPNFVVDFGLPLTFNLSDLVSNVGTVDSVGTLSARYGTLTYNSTNNTFTYTPTTVLQNIDVLSITLTVAGETNTTNVGVTPATTVHYEASFLENHNGWSEVNTSNATQTAEVLGSKVNNFGYEPGYTGGSASTSSTIGSTTDFTFTGTGVDIYANCLSNTGYVSVRVKSADTGKTYLVNTVAVNGDTNATNSQTTINNAPIVSVRDLTHGTYTVTITKVMDTNTVNISGFRVYNTIKDSTVFEDDLEDNPAFYELRDLVLTALNIGDTTSEDYGTVAQMADQVYEQFVTASSDKDSNFAVVLNKNSTTAGSASAQDLLDNGPKNELFLRKNETLVFSVTTARDVQIGLKAPNGSTTYTINGGTANSIASSVDMFYDMGVTPGTSQTYTFTITNTGENILSVTLLKICDDPSAAFASLTAERIEQALYAMGYTDAETPDSGEVEVPVEPEVVYADASLTVDLVDYTGKKIASVDLTANGVAGETAVFTADEILEAVKAQMPEQYALVSETASDVEVVYGGTKTTSIQVGKVATLEITYISLRGKKLGSATITCVQSENGYCRISASEITSRVPSGHRAIWFLPVIAQYGRTTSVIVPVI